MPRFSPPADTQEVEETDEITEIAGELGEVYFIRKEAEDEQKALREEFFEAITASYADQDLARKSVAIPEDVATVADAEDYARQYHSGWRVVESRVEESQDGRLYVTIEEDPAFKPFIAVVERDPWEIPAPTKKAPNRTKLVYGYVVTKTIAAGSVLVDDERMRAVDPDLYNRVTRLPDWWDAITDVIGSKGDPAKVFARLAPYRVMRDDLTSKELDEIKPYTYEGPKQARLNVRYANKDEQAEG